MYNLHVGMWQPVVSDRDPPDALIHPFVEPLYLIRSYAALSNALGLPALFFVFVDTCGI